MLDAIRNELLEFIEYLEANDLGSKHVNYRLREWIFARQRYWGEPVPVIHMEDGTTKVLDEGELNEDLCKSRGINREFKNSIRSWNG